MNRSFILKEIKKSIHEVHADLVFLQEVVGQNLEYEKNHKEWPSVSQFEYLADSLWPHFAYGKNAVYSKGHHGNAILSKFPILSWDNIDISTNRLERRGLLHAVLQVPNQSKVLHAVCLHLGLFELGRNVQINSLCKRIEAIVPHSDPLIIAGDFNDWREVTTKKLEQQLKVEEVFMSYSGEHARTFPSWMPVLKLDRIYYRKLKLKKVQSFSDGHWSSLSDHVAISAEFHL